MEESRTMVASDRLYLFSSGPGGITELLPGPPEVDELLFLSTTVIGVVSVTSSQNAFDLFPDIEHTSLRDISISADSLSPSGSGVGLGGNTPHFDGFVFLFGFTVTSLAPVI